jgi:phosphate transport system substrate-binding protein
LGNPSNPLRVINRNEKSGTRGALYNIVLEPREKNFCIDNDSTCKEWKKADVTNDILRDLGRDGISYGSYPEVCLSPGVARIVPIDGKLPNHRDYPIKQSLSYLYKPNPSLAVKAFIDYVQSEEGKQIITKFVTGSYCPAPESQ